jgi:hypothetical protein
MALCIYETALISQEKSDGLLQSYKFSDSGASSHMVYDETMLPNVKTHDIIATVGNYSKLKVLSKGTYHGHIIDDNGDKLNIKLLDLSYAPELTVNLFLARKAVSCPGVFFVGSDQAFQLKTETQSFTLTNSSNMEMVDFMQQMAEKLLERNGVTPKWWMDDSEQDVLQKVLAEFQENTSKRIMHQLYQTQHYTYS